jgi:hypothetical protein
MLAGRDPNDPAVIQGLTVTSGAASLTGGGLQVGGSLLTEGSLTAAGTTPAEFGGVIGLPVMMWQNIKMQAEIQRAIQPEVNRMLDEGNYVGAALLSMPPGGFDY